MVKHDSSSSADNEIVYVSAMKGSLICKNDLRNCEYWANHLISPVLFWDALTKCLDAELTVKSSIDQSKKECIIYEVGPKSQFTNTLNIFRNLVIHSADDNVEATKKENEKLQDKSDYNNQIDAKRMKLQCYSLDDWWVKSLGGLESF